MSNRNPQPQVSGMPVPPSAVMPGAAPAVEPEVQPEVRPQLPDTKPPEPNNTVKAKKPKFQGIEVIAERDGFYAQSRKVPGDRFMISSMEKLGTWMRCVDPKLQADHEARMKQRRQDQRKRQSVEMEDAGE